MNLIKKLLFGLLLTGALFTTACSDDAKKSNGEACTAASECESNHCDATAKKCAAAPPVKKGDGEACTASSECQSNNCDTSVTPNVCKTAAPVKKANGEACTASSECQSNNCDTSVTPNVCKAAAPVKKANGEGCTASSECQSNNCDTSVTPNVCKAAAPVKKADGETCTKNDECTSDNCDATSNKCAPAAPAKKLDGAPCAKNDECASNECDATSKKCKISAGQECTATAECAKAFPGVPPACIDAESGKKRCSAICTGAGQCPSPYACLPAKEEGTKDVLACSIKPFNGTVADGQPCSLESGADQECKTSGHVCDPVTHTCQAAASTKKADGDPCAAPAECQSNNCDMSATPHVCGAAKKADGAPCAAPAECQSNNCDMSVTLHVCKAAPPAPKAGGEPCSKDDECQSNSCDMSSHTCKAALKEPCSATIHCADMGTHQGVCVYVSFVGKNLCSIGCSVTSECTAALAPLPVTCKDVTPVGGSSQVKACTL